MVSVRVSQNLTMRGGEPIAIVGTGCRFPGGASSPSKLWEMLLDKRDALRAIPMDRWNSEGFHHSKGERAGALNVKHAYLLKENVREWDASFFGINPREAEAVDPQHRILLETVYEAMESGGFTMEAMQGSDTAVYVGVMTADYCEMLLRSPESLPTYFATGTNSSILSNRLSYFYDLKGPSETINTACSSSLVAVHRGVQSLRSGEARMAIAGGANLILNPEFMASESNLHMLSAEGRTRMWDAGANGYARGEGFAAVIMKRLSDAIADGDDITCIIRETGVNSDGRTKGITLPSGEAQTSLIQQVYRRAGLNPFSALDRPQYFEAHGTGTPAGDPIEANGIRDAFFAESVKREGEKLIVGSVKTAMGHTEGAAGLAGLIKTANAIKLGVIPGNLLFQSYSPKILPLLDHLALATETQAWPAPPAGQPRRASVNCFGFGGTNAHAIVESYSLAPALYRKKLMPASTQTPMAIPLVLSANNEASLAIMVSNYRDFIASNDQINLNDLAWTLQNRRSELALKATFAGPTREALLANMTAIIGKTQQSPPAAIGTRRDHRSKNARILGVFTGQGAQWANMGRELVLLSSMAKASVVHLDAALAELPDGPTWTLEDVICEKQAGKRIDEAEFSQPVCTAVQVMLVDILRSVGHKFTTVVGHSSGEIGAAYAAGVVSASEAIKIAYYRGLHTKIAQGPSGKEGTMLAAGLSHEDADEFCAHSALSGRIQVAASNAPESVTLSGDMDAIKEAKIILDDRGIFARALKVNKAYHSQHMNPVSVPYMASLRACRINPKLPSDGCTWVSSVTGDPIIDEVDLKALTSVYWKDNMLKPVLFSTAVEQAVLGEEPFDFAIEVGPHTALKGPFLQTYKAATGVSLPYGGTLARFTNDIAAMSNCLGGLMNHVAPSALTTSEYTQSFQSGVAPALATGLPTYAWDHSQIYWGETRYSRKYRQRTKPRHDLLGAQLPDDLEHDMRYRNTIRVPETPWLAGHKVQGQIVYPGAAYLVMALEASKDLAKDKQTKLVELLDIELSRAIALEEGSAGVDTLLTLKKTHEGPLNGKDFIEAEFSIFSAIGADAETWDLNMKGRLRVVLADSNTPDIILPVRDDTPVLLSTLNVESFYKSLVGIGFNYTGLFHRLTGIGRRMNRATATAIEYPEDPEMPAMMHPALMDASFQTVFAALHFPGDGGMASPYLPTGIKCLRISTDRDEAAPATQVTIDTFITSNENMKIVADIEMCDSTSGAPRLQIEGLACTSLERANADNDVELYSQTIWRPEVSKTASKLALSSEDATAELSMVDLCERLAYMYLRKLDLSVSRKEVETFSWNHQRIFQFIDHLFPVVENGQHSTLRAEWAKDDPTWLEIQAAKHMDQVDIQLITTVGQNLLSVVRGETNLLECMMKDDMLNRYYALGQQIKESNVSLSRAVGQVVHRYAGMKILEVGAGSGSVTKGVFEEIGHLFKSYTFTDSTDKSFEKARENLQKWTGKMKFQPLEIEGDVTEQGFEKHSFDMVIASNVVQTSQNLKRTMENIRLLLKPGGYVLLQEISVPDVLRVKFMTLGLPAWWLGDDDSRRFGPAASMSQWTSLLMETGFSGVDQVTNDLADRPMFLTSVVLSQALSDEVKFLREPLCPPALPIVLKDICIIGGNQARNAEITAYISESCRRLGNELPRLSYIDSIDKAHLHTTPVISVIFVQDLDQPIWKDLKQETITGLQSVVDQARQVLWVTSGCRLENAYANMSVGVGRGMQSEYAHVRFQLLDIEPSEAETSNDLIAAASLRLFADDAIRIASPNILWTAESELVVKNGKFLIPRITADQVLNDRLNARRRPIQKKVSPAETQVIVSESEGPYVLSEPHLSMIATKDTSAIKIKVTHSLLSAVKVGKNTHMYLTIGKVVEGGDIASGKDVLAFSNINASIIDVPASQVVPIYVKVDSPPRFIESVALTFVSTALFSKLRHGSTVLFLGPDRSLASAFQATAEALGLKTFSASTLPVPAGSKTIYINPHTPERILRKILPAKIDMVLDFSGLDQPSSISALQGSTECINTKVHDLFGKKPGSGINEAPDYLHDELLKAHFVAANFVDRSEDPEIVSLSQISNSKTRAYTAVLDFTKASEVSVQIAPINTKELFRSDKTYLLVGCTGGLGQALCRWMVQNGVKHLALTTRNPKSVNQVWLDEMAAAGGNIQIFACDVTDGTSLRKTHEEICRKMPQIVGVANAAMVLADRLFNDITLEDFQISLKPKVEGTNQLDVLFGERSDLDFFILFSSLANTVGNRGQTNYLAANGYMQTIAAQRRARGLTASVMHIGMVIGIGVVSQDAALESSLKRQKWMAISEPEFLDMFAECILVGRPNSRHSNDIITGLPRNSTLPRADNPWYASNPRFSHMVLKEEGEDNSPTGGSSLPIKQRLAAATTAEQRAEIIQGDFLQKMSRILQASAENIEVKQPLLALGVDSLMAMEIRSWFLTSIDVDVPVLKVLGGGSIQTLCAEAGALVKIFNASAGEIEISITKGTSPPSEASASSGASTPSLLATRPSTPGLSEDFTWLSRAGSETGEYDGVELLPGMERVGRMSFSQERLWFLQSFLTNPAAYNITLAYRIKGPFRVADFNQAFYDLIDRHETLRTAFFTDKTNNLAYLGAVEKTPFVMVQKPYTGEAQVKEEFNLTNNHSYDLENAESMKATLLIESPTSHVLIMGFHHIAVDATSSQILVRDIAAIYSGDKLAPLKYQYIDYANKQRATVEQALSKDVAYWKSEFPDVPETLPLFDFGTVKSRKPLTEYNIRIMDARLDASFTATLKAASQKLRVTPFHLHLATLQTMLHKLLNIDDVCIGITDANKNDPDHVDTLGFFVNLLPLRFKVEGSRSFAKLTQQARDKTLAALEHSQIPYNVLLDKLEVPRSTTSNPMFQVLMNYKMGSLRSVPFGECEAEVVDFQDASNPYDLQFDVELAVDGTTLITVSTQSYLYSEEDLSTVLRSYTHLLKTLSSKPSLPIKDQSVFSIKEAHKAVTIGTGPRVNIDQSITINRMFDWAVKARSNNIAVVDNVGGKLTWIEMASWVSTIAAHLLGFGVKPQAFVGVNCEPSAMSVCYWLAVIRIGAIYVPLDTSNPAARLELIVNDCKPVAIICDEQTWEVAQRAFRAPNRHIFKLSVIGGRRTKYTEDMSKPHEIACVIYTSGTTGTPKGTLLTNFNFVNHIYGVNKEWDIGREVVLQPTNLGFDLSLAQMMQFVASQGKLVVASLQTRTDPMALVNLMVEHQVTYTIVTPSVYVLILRQDPALLQQLTAWRTAFSCGEPLTSAIVQQFQKVNLPSLRLLNSCGPTEITIINSAWEIPLQDPNASEQNMIVGSSLPNYSTYILDDYLNPVPVGFPGEMVCGGASISQGYLGQTELTAAKWVADPFASDADLAKGWNRMYRTGDRAKMLPDGRFVFLGRIAGDNQVKLRGVRIELDDIRSTIVRESKGAITEAAVCLRGEGENAFLVAFAVLNRQITDTRKFLAGLPLSSAMIPNTFVTMDILPRTPNGKIDMRALAALDLPTHDSQQKFEDSAPIDLTMTEASLKEIWSRCLPAGVSVAGVRGDSDFFVLGGNSMLLVNVQAMIRDTFNANIALYTLFQSSTLESMAAQIEAVSQVETTVVINWDSETALDPRLSEPSPHSLGLRPISRSYVEVILTGATGFLGTQILRELVADERVGKIHCIAIRLADGKTSRSLPIASSKMVKYYGDLASERLGLTNAQFTELSKKADRIIHNGCDVSFLKSYKSLSASNLGSTKELVRLAMVRKTPFHYVSTAGVASFIPEQDLGERFIPDCPPPVDGSMGYAASKWAGEKYLVAAATQFGLPIWVHRPSNILGEGAASVNMTANIIEYSMRIGAVPRTPGIDGHMQFVEVDEVAYLLVNSLFARGQDGAVVKNHCGDDRVRIRELGTYLENKFGLKLAVRELDDWVEKVQKAGLSVGLGSLIREVLRNSAGTASLKTLSRRRY